MPPAIGREGACYAAWSHICITLTDSASKLQCAYFVSTGSHDCKHFKSLFDKVTYTQSQTVIRAMGHYYCSVLEASVIYCPILLVLSWSYKSQLRTNEPTNRRHAYFINLLLQTGGSTLAFFLIVLPFSILGWQPTCLLSLGCQQVYGFYALSVELVFLPHLPLRRPEF